jgi:hypothetical protein
MYPQFLLLAGAPRAASRAAPRMSHEFKRGGSSEIRLARDSERGRASCGAPAGGA